MRWRSIILALVAAAILAGCGGGGDGSSTVSSSEPSTQAKSKKPLREAFVTLDGYSGPENLGVLMAEWKDYFQEAGFDEKAYAPTDPDRPIEYTDTRTVDVGISREPEVILAQSKGIPVVAIGSLIDRPTAALIWLEKSQIDDVSDLKGKIVATAGLPIQKELLRAVLASADLSLDDVELKDFGYNVVPALVKGKVDAVFGASWNLEGIQLEEMGLDPVVTKVQDLGIPAYDEYVVIARRDRLEKDPQFFRDFMTAVSRGTETAIQEPDVAFEAVNEDVEADYRVSPNVREAQVDATLPLLSASGAMDPVQAKLLVDWMYDEGMIRKKVPVSSLLTNEFLPPPEP